MSHQKVVVVIGITGKQGGSVAHSLLKDGKWKVRGITRDVNKPNAKELISKGVELIEGDMIKPEVLKKAFHGAYGVFALTNFWDPSQMGKETEVGNFIADIAKEAGVQHYIWSSLPNVEKISNGKYHVPHFTDKAKVDEHIHKIGLKATIVAPSFFLENFNSFFAVKKDETGTAIFKMPISDELLLTAVAIEKDMGPAVRNILDNPSEWIGKWVPLYGVNESVKDYVKQFSEVSGLQAKYIALPSGTFGTELQQMLDYFQEFGYFGPQWDKTLSQKVNPNFTTFAKWVKDGNLSVN